MLFDRDEDGVLSIQELQVHLRTIIYWIQLIRGCLVLRCLHCLAEKITLLKIEKRCGAWNILLNNLFHRLRFRDHCNTLLNASPINVFQYICCMQQTVTNHAVNSFIWPLQLFSQIRIYWMVQTTFFNLCKIQDSCLTFTADHTDAQ